MHPGLSKKLWKKYAAGQIFMKQNAPQARFIKQNAPRARNLDEVLMGTVSSLYSMKRIYNTHRKRRDGWSDRCRRPTESRCTINLRHFGVFDTRGPHCSQDRTVRPQPCNLQWNRIAWDPCMWDCAVCAYDYLSDTGGDACSRFAFYEVVCVSERKLQRASLHEHLARTAAHKNEVGNVLEHVNTAIVYYDQHDQYGVVLNAMLNEMHSDIEVVIVHRDLYRRVKNTLVERKRALDLYQTARTRMLSHGAFESRMLLNRTHPGSLDATRGIESAMQEDHFLSSDVGL